MDLLIIIYHYTSFVINPNVYGNNKEITRIKCYLKAKRYKKQ